MIITHWKKFINQCGCNNNHHKLCLTQWSKKVVSNIYKMSLQRLSVIWCSPCQSVTINSYPSISFCFKMKGKKLWWQGYFTTGKKSFTVLCCRKLRRKMSKWQIFLLTHLSSCNTSTATDINQTILWWPPNPTQGFP